MNALFPFSFSYSKGESWQNVFPTCTTFDEIALVDGLVQYNPRKRLTAAEVHIFFTHKQRAKKKIDEDTTDSLTYELHCIRLSKIITSTWAHRTNFLILFFSSRLSHFNFNRHSIWTTLHDVTMMFSNLYQKYRSGCLSGWYMCIIYVYMSYFSTNKVLEKKKKICRKIYEVIIIQLNWMLTYAKCVCMRAYVLYVCVYWICKCFFMCPRYGFICFPSSCPFALGISALFWYALTAHGRS